MIPTRYKLRARYKAILRLKKSGKGTLEAVPFRSVPIRYKAFYSLIKELGRSCNCYKATSVPLLGHMAIGRVYEFNYGLSAKLTRNHYLNTILYRSNETKGILTR